VINKKKKEVFEADVDGFEKGCFGICATFLTASHSLSDFLMSQGSFNGLGSVKITCELRAGF